MIAQWNTIGERLRSLRKERNWTLKQVSKKTKLSVGYVCDIEIDRTDPSLKTLEKFARAYGMNISALFQGVGK